MLFRYGLIFRNFIRHLSTVSQSIDPCTGCEVPCTTHVPYPSEILKTIDQGSMINSVSKHRRHLCIGQSISPSQWPKDIKTLPGDYIQELSRIINKKTPSIGYPIKLTLASISSETTNEQTADWYLFPDQIKIKNVHLKQIDEIIEKLFVNDQSIIQIKNSKKSIEEQLKENNPLPIFNENLQCEKLNGLWILICSHQQNDQRCGVIGPILFDEIEKYARQTNQSDNIHCLKISHIGGHKFAGNVIIYPSGTWYGRILTCHIPLLIDAYTSSSQDLKDKLKPLLRGYLDTTSTINLKG